MICYHCNKETRERVSSDNLHRCVHCAKPFWEAEADASGGSVEQIYNAQEKLSRIHERFAPTNPELLKPLGCYATDLLHDWRIVSATLLNCRTFEFGRKS